MELVAVASALAAVAAMVVVAVVADVALRRAHRWAHESRLGAQRRARLPPGEMGWPLVGTMWSFLRAFKSGNPDAFIGSFIRRFGRTGMYKTFMFGSPTILVTAPEGCKQVLMDDEKFVTGWPTATVELIGKKSFITMGQEEHKRLRRLTAAPINGPEALSTYLRFIEETVVSTLERWSTMGEIAFLTELRRFTFKIIMQIFMGGAGNSTTEALERVYTDLNYGMRAMAINVPGFAYHKALKARKTLVGVLQGVLDERRAMGSKGFARSGKDMMDGLMEVQDEHGRRLSDEEIIDILVMYLNAGHESSGHITMWTTVFLEENPEIFRKAKAEQEEIIRSRPPTQEGLNLKDIRKMQYLSQVIDETLRLVNISFVSFRRATDDVYMNGYLIPKDWKVQLWYRNVHMDPDVYADPKKFNPSRWEGPPPKAGTFLPFGLGSRLCPGNELAKLEISVFIHHFLLGYKITRKNPKCRVRFLPHPRPVDNCLARITKISDKSI